MGLWIPQLALSLAVSDASAGVYTVSNTNDSGPQSLRWAIEQVNAQIGRDRVLFAPQLAGAVIRPLTPLPNITDAQTIINGDINRDGKPDVTLNGRKAVNPLGGGTVSGLILQARGCVVRGLAIIGFSGDGIVVLNTRKCVVAGCYFGVTRTGRPAGALGRTGVSIWKSRANLVGGTTAGDRNVFAPSSTSGYGAILLYGSSDNTVAGNYVGLTPNGINVMGLTRYGVFVNGLSASADGNIVGGATHGSQNTFVNCTFGALLEGATNTQILGNLFGLKADGNALAPISTGVSLASATTNTQIGGTTAGARNVFAGGASQAIEIRDPGTENNVIQGNYFGTNRAGTARRRLTDGIRISGDAGWQLIGGTTPAAGNHFVAYNPDLLCDSIVVAGPGSATIRHNVFGVLPAGGGVNGIGRAIMVLTGATAQVRDNTITHAAARGLWVRDAGTQAAAFRNTFRYCAKAVVITTDATCRLGNLGNTTTTDDGGNEFKPTNTWFIWNTTPNVIKAEGCDFGTTSMAAIDAKIYDQLDCPQAGRVDFDPLTGGTQPSAWAPPLAVTGAGATPARAGGAEIVFSLSRGADVSVVVLNLAGRPVATVARDETLAGGTQRVLWDGRADRGTSVPAGRYLVRITARSGVGEQTQVLAALTVGR